MADFAVIVETHNHRWRAETKAEDEKGALNRVRHRFCIWFFGRDVSFNELASLGIRIFIKTETA